MMVLLHVYMRKQIPVYSAGLHGDVSRPPEISKDLDPGLRPACQANSTMRGKP